VRSRLSPARFSSTNLYIHPDGDHCERAFGETDIPRDQSIITERQNPMGDKSPKSNQKKKSQKDAKAASKQNKKNKTQADKQKK